VRNELVPLHAISYIERNKTVTAAAVNGETLNARRYSISLSHNTTHHNIFYIAATHRSRSKEQLRNKNATSAEHEDRSTCKEAAVELRACQGGHQGGHSYGPQSSIEWIF